MAKAKRIKAGSIPRKIAKLRGEGKPGPQAVAIAKRMAGVAKPKGKAKKAAKKAPKKGAKRRGNPFK
jgi:hypothetical protein